MFVYDIPSHAGSLVRLKAQHAKVTGEYSLLNRANMLFMTLKNHLHQPETPVWGERFLYAPVIVEMMKMSKSKPAPNWNYFLGFGQRFLLNASQTDDGVLYFCVGFAISTTCKRDRHVIVYASLAPDARRKLAELHAPGKVQKLMRAVQQSPLRRYSLGSIIPGTVVPRVVGTILEAEATTQQEFFDAVETLFSPGGQLPREFHLENKDQVLYFTPRSSIISI